jgi:hypothetical protein
MESLSAAQSLIFRSHGWCAGLEWYDFLQSIRFGSDGWGFMNQGDGQSIKIEARFRYSVPGPRSLRLEFFDTPSCYGPEDLSFERTAENAIRDVAFDLLPGPHEVACGTMGGLVRRPFAWLLRFQSEPFPFGHQPSETLLDYYGRTLRPHEARLTFGCSESGPTGES